MNTKFDRGLPLNREERISWYWQDFGCALFVVMYFDAGIEFQCEKLLEWCFIASQWRNVIHHLVVKSLFISLLALQ